MMSALMKVQSAKLPGNVLIVFINFLAHKTCLLRKCVERACNEINGMILFSDHYLERKKSSTCEWKINEDV